MKPTAYEGKEKYIFISYAHKDSDQVLRILERMELDGYRIWYDDGIAPGSEWPENIAQHLDSCAVVIAFVSANSIASANCRREVTFALSRQKPFLGILLEQTKMSLGMELQLSAQQCIMRHNFRREEDFINKILSCPDLEPCRAVREPEPEVQSEETEIPAVVAPLEKPAVPPGKKKEKKAKPPREKKRLPRWMIPAAVAALVLLIVLINVFSQIRITEDLLVKRDSTSLTIRKTAITAEVMKKINKLEKLKHLYIYDSSIGAEVFADLNTLKLQSLTVENVELSSLDVLTTFPDLYSLKLINCALSDDVLPLEQFPALEVLVLSDNPNITDISGLNVSVLRELGLENTGVKDISMLSSAEKLSDIDCSGTDISDISMLAGLRDLDTMDFSGCPISEVTEEFQSLSVQGLYFTGCGLTDVSGFSNFTVLRNVFLGGNYLSDIEWLSKSASSLQRVDLSLNPLNREDIVFLEDAYDIWTLYLDGIPMEDLTLVKGMAELEVLSARACGIQDISGLSGLEKLGKLYLSQNSISDVSGLPDAGFQSPGVLDLAYNSITDVSAIPQGHYDALTLHGNVLSCDAADFEGVSGSMLTLDYNESLHSFANAKNFYEVYVSGCPADRQLALKDVLKYSTYFVTDEELLLELEHKTGITYCDLESIPAAS